ncbi:hypothetical protein FDK38_005334 [Candidozyma auris]|nr:hypothetical protein FDK38_005334 [[Candida] auris]
MPVTQHIPKPGSQPHSEPKKPQRHIIRLKPVDFKYERPRFPLDTITSRHSRCEGNHTSPAFRRSRSRTSSLGYKHVDKYAEFFINDQAVPRDVPKLQNQYLRPNAKFVGEQQSGTCKYDIRVELKSVDLVSSIVTGFFQISGLTDEHPLITTCFKGEIINNPLNSTKWQNHPKDHQLKRYAFITEDRNWGSFPQNDIDHWRTLTRASSSMSEEDLLSKLRSIHAGDSENQYIYMRWKEEFLLPDSRIKQLKNASFEGFYYVVLNIGGRNDSGSGDCFSSRIIPGTISGLYYHTQNDKFQSLSLRYVEDRQFSYDFDFA